MVAVPDHVWCADEERFEPGLAIDQRQAGEVLTIQIEEVETK